MRNPRYPSPLIHSTGWNSLRVSFIYWLMVPSSLFASVMLCDSLRVDNLIWCVVACYVCVWIFFCFAMHTNLVNDVQEEKCVNCFYCMWVRACVYAFVLDTLHLFWMSNNTRFTPTHLCQFSISFFLCCIRFWFCPRDTLNKSLRTETE